MARSLDSLSLKGGLIVSCQADPGSPLRDSAIMAAMARSAQAGGAVGIRADGPLDIAAIKAAVKLPVIGIYKLRLPHQHPRVYITPTFESAEAVARLGCEIIALHVLPEYDSDVPALKRRIQRIKQELDVLVMADIATLADAAFAVERGADIVATTSARYAYPDEKMPGPAIDLVREIDERLGVPVIAEGGYQNPEQCAQAIAAGAHAVVVGAAITAPDLVVANYVRVMKGK